MIPNTIKKRDGRTVPFDTSRIKIALEKACLSIGQTDTDFIPVVINCIETRLMHKYANIETKDTTVEEVQDLVEVCLMDASQYDVTKEYILYRHKAKEKREKSINTKITKHALSVKKRDGSTVAFDIDEIKKAFTLAGKEHKDVVDVDALTKAFRSNVYDGISTSDISKAMLMTAKSFIERDPAYSFVCTKLFLASYYKDLGNIALGSKTFRADYEATFKEKLELMIEGERLSEDLRDFDMDVICAALKPERDFILEERSISQLHDRYFIHLDKEKQELPQAFWMRVAMGLCSEEKDKEATAISFYEILSTLRFISSTPTLFHSGTRHPQFSSCYLTTVEDDLNHIFKCYGDNAQMSKWS